MTQKNQKNSWYVIEQYTEIDGVIKKTSYTIRVPDNAVKQLLRLLNEQDNVESKK